ncbi:hypothetical protein N7462_005140 [Penicillium macrosclerotiorum]|uniref:uncharacterized protein n=1 Tax=Penicillium macrosclerotiorum TaxID=303699 RepID=UPI002548391C|nr:uncharacterized protein N7462_005140 [Penicillium macrosclerotiorum]KAJ5690748.1 hypothetical protein N7462_005140 [Penicillium macrosclerotiorum]
MGDLKGIRDAFSAANSFLNPEIQKLQGQSLLEILNYQVDPSIVSDDARRVAVIKKALDILSHIHVAFVAPVEDPDTVQQLQQENEEPSLEDAKRRRMLHAILDLISLEGIYPSLSSGVGIPLQQRVISVLPAGVIAKQTQVTHSSVPHNEALLECIMRVLLNITLDDRPSIQPVIRGRILSDLISGAADLAFNPHLHYSDDRIIYQKEFSRLIDETPSAVLLPTLSSFLQADTVAWFKSSVSSHLSHVPLRPGGVLQTIMFIVSQFAPSLGQEARNEPSNGPHFTVQAIMQISKLLSSVPQGIDPESYFTNTGAQLLELLDGDDPDLKKTSSYVIGNGILGKRSYGAPGTIGHSIFVEPAFGVLTAELNDSTWKWMTLHSENQGHMPIKSENPLSPNTIVNSDIVGLALDRLRSLALQHPNPGLVKRVVYPVLLPLWGLACYSQEHQLAKFHDKAMELLLTYFSISVGIQPLKKLVDNLLWDGGFSWTYGTDPQREIVLQKRKNQSSNQSNLIGLIDSLQGRTDLFVKLLGSDPSAEERTGDIFLYVSQSWLVHSQESDQAGKQKKTQKLGESEDIMQKLVSAKVAEKLLNTFKDTLSRRPLRVLELIKQLIDGELHARSRKETEKQEQKRGKVSLTSLANIVPEEEVDSVDTDHGDAQESLSTAFSLLSTVIASPEFALSPETKSLLESIKHDLDQLIPLLPNELSKPATTSSMLMEIQLVSPEHDDLKPPPPHVADIEKHPEGFSMLSKLILDASPVLDIPSTLTLLLSIVMDVSESTANEEFIYLNAIKLIGTLASRHPRTVVKTLVDNYADKSEQRTLDQRLKIGESLLRTVQDLGEALTGETAGILGEGMVSVAGRRGHKPQTQQTRKHDEEKERRRKEREQRKQREPKMPAGWSIPDIPSIKQPENIEDEVGGDDDSEDESPEQKAYAANIIAAWAAGASTDEVPDDLRVRTSALSILASAVQTNIIGLGPTIVSSAVDLALSTLTLEPSPESAILRRASVVLILDILKALDSTREQRNGKDVGFGFSLTDDGSGSIQNPQNPSTRGPSTIGHIPSMVRTLGFVESIETDSIVRGHLRALIESLEAWMEKSLMWGIGAHGDESQPRLELGDRIAGLDVDPMAQPSAERRPRIEEIE